MSLLSHKTTKILALWIACFFVSFASASSVKPQHPVNEFIRQQSLALDIPVPGFYSLPLHHQDVVSYLQSIHQQVSKLHPRDQKRLELFLMEFGVKESTNPYPLRYKDQDQSIYAQVHYQALGTLNDSAGQDKKTLWDQYGLELKGQLSQEVSYISEGSIIRAYSDEARFLDNYDPSMGLPYNTPDARQGNRERYNTASFDSYRAAFSWSPSLYRIEFGNDWNQWGPGIEQNAGLGTRGYFWLQDLQYADHLDAPDDSHTQIYRQGYSHPGESAPMPQLRFRMDWGQVSYTQFAAQRQGLSHQPDAKLYGHRLDVLWGDLNIGIYELLASAREDTDWVYWIPLVPFFVAEHHTGDRDNTTLGLDLNYRIPGWGRLYTELFLDDLLSPGALLDNYWGNKFAWTLGSEWVGLWSGNVLQLEYARVEPWLYTHHTPNNQFQHHGALIGSSLAPNSHQVFVGMQQALHAQLTLALEYRLNQHQHLDRGSSILQIHHAVYPEATWEDSLEKDFLGDTPETRHFFQAALSWQNWQYARIDFGVFHEKTKHLNSQISPQGPSEYGVFTQFDLRY